jgi:probable F420-dependent oxidoreductase
VSVGIGVQLPQTTTAATAKGLLEAALAAEAAGLRSVSVTERVLWPVASVRMADGSDGFPPEHQKAIFDAFEVLAAVAAVTERIDLITAVVCVLFQSPVNLARRAATLDQLSGGRLRFGVGQGWMDEEFAVSGVPPKRKGAGFEEHVAAMRAMWAPDPVSFSGRFYEIPPAYHGPKPVRDSGVPILVGTITEPGTRRAIRFADGWLPGSGVGTTWESLERGLRFFGQAADEAGRPHLPIHLRAHTLVTEKPIDGPDDRIPLSGSVEQIVDDLDRLEKLGVGDICLNQTQRGVPFDEQLDAAVRVQEALT